MSPLLKKAHQAEHSFNDPVNVSNPSNLADMLEKLDIDEVETRLEVLLRDLNISHMCEGVVADGDMSLKWSFLFENWDQMKIKGERSVSPWSLSNMWSYTILRAPESSCLTIFYNTCPNIPPVIEKASR